MLEVIRIQVRTGFASTNADLESGGGFGIRIRLGGSRSAALRVLLCYRENVVSNDYYDAIAETLQAGHFTQSECNMTIQS